MDRSISVGKKRRNGSIPVKTTMVFAAQKAADSQVIVHRGGARSSKSYSIMQWIIESFFIVPKVKILILRKYAPSLRTSCKPLFYEIIDQYGLRDKIREFKLDANIFSPVDGMIHFSGLDDPEKIRCHVAETEVFTDHGWVNIKDIKTGDKVASLDPKTKKADFYPVNQTYSYDYEGEMICPASVTGERGAYTDFCVTPNHKMLTHTRRRKQLFFIEAKDLYQTYYVPQAAEFDCGNIVDYYEIPKMELPLGRRKNYRFGKKPTKFEIIPFLKFLGWYLSEGSLDKGSTNSECTINISQVKKRGIKQIKEDLKDFPYGSDARAFKIYGKDLYDYLKQFGKCADKFVPREILNLHPLLLRHLFDALIGGDGCVVSKNKRNYVSTSYQLANDVSEIATKLGYCTIIRKTRDKKIINKNNPNGNWNDAWIVDITNRKEVRLENKKSIHYKGKVYCLEVFPHHNFLTRLNGKPAFTGNSSDFNLVWMEEASQFTMNDFINLKLRLSSPIVGDWRNKIILSFNPVDEHSWIKTDLLDPEKEDLAEIISNYRMNPFLSSDYIRTIEALKDQNENYWRIFAEGQWGRLENIIYTNWRTVSELPEGEEIFGLDFGFSSPTCLVRVLVDGMVAGVEQKIYREELTNSQLIEQMNIIMTPQQKANCPIYADSEDTNRIEEIKNAGFRIYLADKKVVAGINHVRQYQLLIKNDSDDIIKEISGYSHKTDHKGNVMEDPIKGFDHSLDACRYAIFTHYSRMSRHSPNIKVLDWSDDAARDSWDDD